MQHVVELNSDVVDVDGSCGGDVLAASLGESRIKAEL